MPNEPKPAKEKRSEPVQRQNAQDDHEGSAHSPDEFEVMKPETNAPKGKRPEKSPATKA